MFDLPIDEVIDEPAAPVWTDEDDALLEALTEAAWAEECEDEPSVPPVEVFDLVASAVTSAVTPPDLGPVETMRMRARLVSYHQARLLESMMAVADEYTDLDDDLALAMDGAVAEIRAALSLTRRAAESDLDLAASLRDRLPAVLDALREGRIDLRRAWVIVQGTSHLDVLEARTVSDRVLEVAAERTTGQLRALVRRLCLEIDPAEAERRYRHALDERAVVAELGVDSTATITASNLPPDRVASIMDRLTRLARRLRRDGEERTIDQLRADVFLDLLEGNVDGRLHGTLDLRVDIATLVGLEHRTAELGGWGPVVADIARQMTERFGPSWRVGVVDDAGVVVHSGVTRRRPDATLRREVESRDSTCVFPGCRMPASGCDLDHRVRVADGGSTHRDQLVALCRHDHVVRHRFGWTHTRNTDGSLIWTSPLGMEYTRPPPI